MDWAAPSGLYTAVRLCGPVSLKHDGTDGSDGTDGTAIQSVSPVPSASNTPRNASPRLRLRPVRLSTAISEPIS